MHVDPRHLLGYPFDPIRQQVFSRRIELPRPQAGNNITLTWNALGPVIATTASGVPAGTSNPGSPTTGDLFHRTDLGLLIYYDGTRWLTCTEYSESLTTQTAVQSYNATITPLYGVVAQDYGIYLTRWCSVSFVLTTNDGSRFWTVALQRVNGAGTGATITSYSTGTTPDAAGNYVNHDQAINAVLDNTARAFQLVLTKTSTPGNLFTYNTLRYRKIIT
jgi:hypothetical protein